MIDVLLADDHSLVRTGLRMLIEEQPDMRVVGEASDGWETLRLLGDQDCSPDVLVLDLSMPKLGGVEVLRRARRACPEVGVLVLSMYPREHWADSLFEAGASGYLDKSQAQDTFLDAVRTIARGERYNHGPRSSANGRAPGTTPPHHAFTGRELQVFLLVVDGRSIMDIAAELGLGQSTISTHMARIRGKLNVDSVAELVTYAHRAGLIS